jgi:NADP-dependent 3-hydroxy acid dehydrogenase YdfG
MRNFSDELAVITGAGSGHAPTPGMRLVLAGVREDALEQILPAVSQRLAAVVAGAGPADRYAARPGARPQID